MNGCVAGWQTRPHDALRDPCCPAGAVTEREVRRAGRRGRLPAADADRGGLPGAAAGGVAAINDYGIRIDYRTYDCPRARASHRCSTPASPPGAGSWEVHYDPYDAVPGVRAHPGRLGHRRRGRTCRWWPRRSPSSPGATPAGWPPQRGGDDTNETEVAQVLDELLTRAEARPGRQAHRPGRRPHPCRRSRAPAAAAEDAAVGKPADRRSRTGRPVDGDPVRGLRRRRRGRTVVMRKRR